MSSLSEMRKCIDKIDNEIMAMLAERFKITVQIGIYKAKNSLAAKDKGREAEQYLRISELAERYGIEAEFANAYLKTVIDATVKNHEKIAADYRG